MPAALASSLRRLAAAAGGRRARLAERLLEREPAWPPWKDAFRELHFSRPETEAAAATALASAARAAGARDLAARFGLLRARALHRAGSASAAVAAYGRGARELAAAGLKTESAQARAMRVDALALAGRVDEAIREADAARRRLPGRALAPWRTIVAGNRANALRLKGDLDAAVKEYARVARDFDRQGNEYAAAAARMNAGVALLDAGEAEAAQARFGEAARLFEAQGREDPALEARYDLACAQTRAGRLGAGVRALAALADEHRRRGLVRREALCRADLADALLRAGDHASAEREALAAADGFARSGARAERVEPLWIAARAAARDDPRRARAHLRRAQAAAGRAGRDGSALRCRLLALDLAGATPAQADSLRREAERLGQDEVAAECRLLRAGALERRGRLRDALAALAHPSLRAPSRPWIDVAVGTERASIEARMGRRKVALKRLEEAERRLDAVRRGLPGAWLRTTFLLSRLEPVLARVHLLLETGEAADRRAAEVLLDGLAARRFLQARTPREGGGRALARIRRRLEAIYDRLARGERPTRGLAPAERAALIARARRLERLAAESWRRDERRGRSSGGAEGVPARLPRSSAALYVWQRDGRAHALLRLADGADRTASLGDVTSLAALAREVGFHARRLAAPGPTAAPSALGRALADLSDRLLAPLRPSSWPRDLYLVLDPALPDVPWEALPLGDRPLSAAHRLLRVPCLRRIARAGRAGRGSTGITAADANLPAAIRDASRVGNGDGSARILAGEEGTRAAVAHALETRRVVHVAGHGFDAPDAPPLGGVRVSDGWFTAADVPARVSADLVVLGACRTGRGAGTAAIAWGGLPEALLASGARYVLWTADDVEDSAAADFLVDFHGARAGGDPRSAFGTAFAAHAARTGHPAHLLPFRLSGVLR